MKPKAHLIINSLFLLYFAMGADLRAQEEIERTFRDALYQEEVKGDVEGALKAYEVVGEHLAKQRDLAAMVMFRQAECLRKLNRLEEATARYELVLKLYPDHERVVRMSEENLTALGQGSVATPNLADEAFSDIEGREIARWKEIIANSPDLLNAPSDGSAPPLHAAAEKGQLRVAEFLIDNGAQLDVVWENKMPLHIAAAAGHKALCELLIAHGADVNALAGGSTALLAALDSRRVAVAELLLETGAKADIGIIASTESESNEEESLTTVNALNIAIVRGLPLELIDKLIDADATVEPYMRVKSNSHTLRRYTPVAQAIEKRNVDLLRRVLEVDGSLDHKNLPIDPPLIQALENAEEEAPEAVNDSLVKALLESGAEMSEAALQVATKRNLTGWMKVAIDAGVKVNSPSYESVRNRPLHLAAWHRHVEACRLLIDSGADVNLADSTGGTALHYAAQTLSFEVLDLLLDKGADILAKTNTGQMVLDYVPTSNWSTTERSELLLKVLQMLLDRGAKFEAGKTGGLDPLASVLSVKGIQSPPTEVYPFWRDAIRLLLQHGVEPPSLYLDLLQNSIMYDNLDSDEQRSIFDTFWKAKHWTHNSRLPNAVWFSQGFSAFERGGGPYFGALLSKEGLPEPGTLEQFLGLIKSEFRLQPRLDENDPFRSPPPRYNFTNISITRGDEKIIVDGWSLIKDEKKVDLQWGDVVEIPWTESPDESLITGMAKFISNEKVINLRVQVGSNQFLGSGETPNSSVFRIRSSDVTSVDDVQRIAGVGTAYRRSSGTLYRSNSKGDLNPISGGPTPRHGDVIQFDIVDKKAQLSEEALRSGVYICQSLEGPFWQRFRQRHLPEYDKDNLFELELMTPNGLPIYPISWDEVRVRQWDGDVWQDTLLKDLESLVEVREGTIFVVPESEDESDLTPPEWLRDRVKEQLSFSWKLAFEDQPVVDRRFEPHFFELTKHEEDWVFHDMTPKSPLPVLPYGEDLVRSDPSMKEVGQIQITRDFTDESVLLIRVGKREAMGRRPRQSTLLPPNLPLPPNPQN